LDSDFYFVYYFYHLEVGIISQAVSIEVSIEVVPLIASSIDRSDTGMPIAIPIGKSKACYSIPLSKF
jgi:hypothetical protein